MVKILIGLVAAIVIAAGAFFGFEFYVQQRATADVEAAFAQVRAAGNKATHGKVSFDLFSRTVTVADIAAETAAQPPVSVKIGSFKASGVSQPDASRFTADTIDAENVEVVGTMAAQAGWRATYRAPKISVVGYSGPAGPLRQVDPASPTDIYRFVLEHFAAVTAASVTAPTLATTISMGGGPTSGSGDYTYSGIALRDIKDGKIAATTIDRMVFSANMDVSGKPEKISGDVAGFATSDFDAAGATVILDPAHANDDKYYRIYRQATVGAYTLTSEKGLRVRIDGMTIDDIGIRPSRLQLPALIALIQQMPAAGTTPTPAQTRDLLEKVAGIYEGLRVGNAELRGLAFDMPEAPFRLAAIRFNLENGKIGEFAVEGLDARSPKGPVKVARFALKSLDIANLLRMASQFSNPGQKPSPDQLLALLLLLEGTEIKGVIAPYKDTAKPVNIDTLSLNWGQFVGPIPSRARLTVKMTGPIDATDPDPFKMLVTAGKDQAAINFDLGATWTEGTRTFLLAPITAELGDVGTAAARISFSNVPREVFSINPLQAAVMAAQIEAGVMEIALRDIGGVDLVVAQYARTQNMTPDAARRAIIENIKTNGMTMSTTNPDAMAIAGAVTRFIENPRGTLTVKLTPKGKVPAMSLLEALKTNPLTALAKFQVEASTGR
jgi:hypothetical protein